MSRDHDAFVSVIEAWLEPAPAYVDPETVLDRVVDELEATPQRPSWWPAPTMPKMSPMLRVGLGTAVVITVGFVGMQLVGVPSIGGPAAEATPPSTPLPTQTPTEDDHCLSYRGPQFANPAREAPPDVGFIGLPPPDAVPSTPESGELVDCYPVHGGLPYEGMVRLYADGRLIWISYYDDRDAGGGKNSGSTGFLEQRLTREGVRLVIDHIDVSEKHPLRLAEWMPASGWEDQTIRAYVPSGYATCLMVENLEDPFQELTLPLPQKLAMLPASAADFLRDREAVPSDAYDASSDCLGMTTAEARELDLILNRAGLSQDEGRNGSLLEYHVDFDGPAPDAWRLGVWFEPILPDGTITCTSCG